MKRTYKTAQGQLIDIDALRLANEDAIAVGNMKVNARGDQLGPGGEVLKTRNQTMNEYYQIQADPVATMQQHQNQGVSTSETPVPKSAKAKKAAKQASAAVQQEVPVAHAPATADVVSVEAAPEAVAATENTATEQQDVNTTPLRGNLADSIAKEAQVNQTLLKPLNKRNGIQRI